MKTKTALLGGSGKPYADKPPFINGFDAGRHTMNYVFVQAWGNNAVPV
jgi:hypothetical protein